MGDHSNFSQLSEDAARCLAGITGAAPIHEAVFQDATQTGKFKNLMQWSQSSSGKKSIGQGVIDLDVIADPGNWTSAKDELASIMSTIFAAQGRLTILDSNAALRSAHVTIDLLSRATIEELRWEWERASDAAFEKGDETQGEALSRAANALKVAKIDVQAKPSRTTNGAVWIMLMQPPTAKIWADTGVK